ncbi:hypothetical protein IWQ60_000796, partial [Tieghemiomyces parasiticus]
MTAVNSFVPAESKGGPGRYSATRDFFDMPPELLDRIVGELDAQDVPNLCLVNRHLRDHVQDTGYYKGIQRLNTFWRLIREANDVVHDYKRSFAALVPLIARPREPGQKDPALEGVFQRLADRYYGPLRPYLAPVIRSFFYHRVLRCNLPFLGGRPGGHDNSTSRDARPTFSGTRLPKVDRLPTLAESVALFSHLGPRAEAQARVYHANLPGLHRLLVRPADSKPRLDRPERFGRLALHQDLVAFAIATGHATFLADLTFYFAHYFDFSAFPRVAHAAGLIPSHHLRLAEPLRHLQRVVAMGYPISTPLGPLHPPIPVVSPSWFWASFSALAAHFMDTTLIGLAGLGNSRALYEYERRTVMLRRTLAGGGVCRPSMWHRSTAVPVIVAAAKGGHRRIVEGFSATLTPEELDEVDRTLCALGWKEARTR